MFDPNAYPYLAAESYADDIAPQVKADVFYNPTQDWLALLYGGALGRSASIQTEEFDLEAAAAAHAGDAFGEQLRIATSTNAEALSVAPIAAGDHGIWKGYDVGGGACEFVARDALKFVGSRQFIWTARVRLHGRANFKTIEESGFVIGMGPLLIGVPDLPVFYCGGGTANWQLGANGAGFDSGVAAADDTWTWLIIARKSDKVAFYMGTAFTGTITKIQEITWADSLTSCRRYVQLVGGDAMAAGDGFYIDHFSRGIER